MVSFAPPPTPPPLSRSYQTTREETSRGSNAGSFPKKRLVTAGLPVVGLWYFPAIFTTDARAAHRQAFEEARTLKARRVF